MKLEKGRGSRIKTVGELSVEQQLKTPYKVSLKEFGEEVLQKDDAYMKKLWASVQNGLDIFGIDTIYVEVHCWREVTMPNVINYRMKPRVSCPTPTYGQASWKYNRKDGKLEVLWTMPDRETSIALLQNSKIVNPDEKKNLHHVLSFYNGNLDRLCQKEIDELDKLILGQNSSIIIA